MDFEQARLEMVEHQIASRDVTDSRVLEALKRVPREEFVDTRFRDFAYRDRPLPIGEEQTISQPYIVALMAERLELTPDSRVLEIGTGSGYAAAVLAELAQHVYTVERVPSLAEESRDRLARLGYKNVTVYFADGTKGLPREAPFDAVVVAAGGPEVPDSLRRQLEIGGRLLVPVGKMKQQRLVLVRRLAENEYQKSDLGAVRFVPLVGREGWPAGRKPQ